MQMRAPYAPIRAACAVKELLAVSAPDLEQRPGSMCLPRVDLVADHLTCVVQPGQSFDQPGVRLPGGLLAGKQHIGVEQPQTARLATGALHAFGIMDGLAEHLVAATDADDGLALACQIQDGRGESCST